MRIAVTGSIATDHLMTFGGKFSDSLLPDQLARVALSFLVDELQIRRGGVAGNIAFGLARLGLRPVLVGAVGRDFDDYRSWLERHGVDCSGVHVSQVAHTARFVCTTDEVQAQIASFYPGAMAEAREIELGPLLADGPLDLVLVGANDPEAMLRHTREARERGIPFVADPSQQLAWSDGERIRELIDGAEILFSNDYEAGLIERKTGWGSEEVLARVGTRVTTHGKDGAVIERRGAPELRVPAAATDRAVDPTGVGDAFRAGYLAALAAGLEPTRCAQVGALLATHVLETVGTQEYRLERQAFLDRLGEHYGEQAVADVAPRLTVAAS